MRKYALPNKKTVQKVGLIAALAFGGIQLGKHMLAERAIAIKERIADAQFAADQRTARQLKQKRVAKPSWIYRANFNETQAQLLLGMEKGTIESLVQIVELKQPNFGSFSASNRLALVNEFSKRGGDKALAEINKRKKPAWKKFANTVPNTKFDRNGNEISDTSELRRNRENWQRFSLQGDFVKYTLPKMVGRVETLKKTLPEKERERLERFLDEFKIVNFD